MGSVIPPSRKVIIGMTTSPSFLSVRIRFGEQYYRATPCGMWYLALKPSIPVGEFYEVLEPTHQAKGVQKKFLKEGSKE